MPVLADLMCLAAIGAGAWVLVLYVRLTERA
jgi:hypothetical protein